MYALSRAALAAKPVHIGEESSKRVRKGELALAVSVVSAVKLERRQMEQIERKMRRLTGFQELRMESTVDPALIAGLVISYGSGEGQVIDLSVKGQLAQMAERLETWDKRQGWDV
ncbi:ATP synthase delta chain, chloroplastic-like [Wolffia australiana]